MDTAKIGMTMANIKLVEDFYSSPKWVVRSEFYIESI